MVRREPRAFGHAQSRWSLKRLLQSCDWLQLETLSGLSQLLKRLGIRFKRARSYVHSPDADYEAKVSYLNLCRMRAWYEPMRYVFLYLDEVTVSVQGVNRTEIEGVFYSSAGAACPRRCASIASVR